MNDYGLIRVNAIIILHFELKEGSKCSVLNDLPRMEQWVVLIISYWPTSFLKII